MRSTPEAAVLNDVKIHVRLKLAALWTSVMLCYIYGDIFSFFKPGTLRDILAGHTGPLATQGGLLAAAVLLALPGLMVFVSVSLAPAACRWTNIALGIVYTLVILATLPGAWIFTIALGVVEAALTLAIVWHGWTWPRQTDRR